MNEFLKQCFCPHKDITTTTEVYVGSPFIVKSLIQCSTCKKTFAQHPNAKCCHVEHIHHQMIWEYMMKDVSNFKKQGS